MFHFLFFNEHLQICTTGIKHMNYCCDVGALHLVKSCICAWCLINGELANWSSLPAEVPDVSVQISRPVQKSDCQPTYLALSTDHHHLLQDNTYYTEFSNLALVIVTARRYGLGKNNSHKYRYEPDSHPQPEGLQHSALTFTPSEPPNRIMPFLMKLVFVKSHSQKQNNNFFLQRIGFNVVLK